MPEVRQLIELIKEIVETRVTVVMDCGGWNNSTECSIKELLQGEQFLDIPPQPVLQKILDLLDYYDECAKRQQYIDQGHSPHCASRLVWGDGSCECRVNDG